VSDTPGGDGSSGELNRRPGSRPVNAVKRVLRRRRKPAEPPALLRTPKPSLTYRLVSYLLVFPVYRVLFRGRTAGNANVPQEGALVVVANHGSHLDPPLLGHALGRPVAFMAKAELFRVPLLLPVAIINSHRAWGTGSSRARLVPVHIRIGTPIPPPASRKRADLDAATAACQAQINALLDQGLISGAALPPAAERSALPPSS
jgi:1-acyl-sn-glycerol-3-phosphate acyltransferase